MGLRAAQVRLKKLSTQIARGKELNPVDKEYLRKALYEIADGQNAEAAFGANAKRGERKGKHVRDVKLKLEFVYGYIITAIAPESEDGLGLTLKEAVKLIKNSWSGLPTEATIIRYWNNVKGSQTRSFVIKTD